MRTREGDKETDILKAAIEVFGSDGFANAKMHSIADKAGIGIGTVYLYFKNKDKIIIRIFETVWNGLYEKIVAVRKKKDMRSVDKLNAVIDIVFDYFSPNRPLILVFVNEQQQVIRANPSALFQKTYENTLLECERIVAEGQKNGAFDPVVAAEFIRHFFFGSIRYLLLQWAAAPHGMPVSDLKKNIKKVMLKGIAL